MMRPSVVFPHPDSQLCLLFTPATLKAYLIHGSEGLPLLERPRGLYTLTNLSATNTGACWVRLGLYGRPRADVLATPPI